MWWRPACGAALVVFVGCSDGSSSRSPEPESITSTISKNGGTVSVDGASLIIPKGALPTPTPISIDKTTIPVPRGYVGYSAVYSFRPGGLVFTKPVKVTIQFAGDGKRAGVYWSSAATFQRLGGDVKGDEVTASVAHFSSGFVGIGGAPDVGMSSEDAGTTPGAAVDASSGDTPLSEAGSATGKDVPEGGT